MIKRLLIVILIGLITSCAQKPPADLTGFHYSHQLTLLADLENWEVSGRMSIQTQEDAFSASFKWRKLINYQRIEITGMLGQTYAILEIEPDKTLLTIKDEAPVLTNNLDELMWSRLGFTIPVELLTSWIKAYPFSQSEGEINTDKDGFIQDMSYRGWQAKYKRYKKFTEINTLYLPSRTTVTNSRETIKLAVKEWQPL